MNHLSVINENVNPQAVNVADSVRSDLNEWVVNIFA